MLDVRKLIMLRAIASEGSIAAAGRVLRYTRSAVSQQLTALESEVGTALVNRARNRVTLTPAGHQLVEHTERILVELRAAEAMLSSDAADIAGLLRVGVPFREGPRLMSRALTEVRSRFPEMEIRLVATTDEAGGDEVRRDQLDMVIMSRYGVAHPRTAPGLREWVLGHDPCACACRRTTRWRGPPTARWLSCGTSRGSCVRTARSAGSRQACAPTWASSRGWPRP